MSNAYFCEVIEPQPVVAECQCSVCGNALVSKLTEAMMHTFVGSNNANDDSHIVDFEEYLPFASVVYWDVGHSGADRYIIYADEFGDAVAWYDQINAKGFKPSIFEL